MEKQQKKRFKTYLSWALTALLVAALAFMPLLAANRDTADGPTASILSAEVARADISAQIIGGGTLESEAAVEITVPAAVKLTGYLVGNGDTVRSGDPIATADRVTIMTAITEVQETLDYLAEEIESIRDEEAGTAVTAQAGGTLKILYAEAGEDAAGVMLEHGSLAVLSLDGLMEVELACETGLSAGDRVTVTLSDETAVEGIVGSNLEGILTVTIEDDGYAVGEAVRVSAEEGELGTGVLAIHSPWNAVAYSGTISEIHYEVGDSVSAGKTLMELSDPGPTAEYQALANQRREYGELMLELFELYQTELVTAPCDGIVSGVDTEGAYLLSAGAGWQLTLLANAPNGDDETAYTNYIGRIAAVGLDGLVLKMNPHPQQITDYTDLSAVPMDPALMTEDAVYAETAPIYELVDGTWAQIEASALTEGDVLLFAGDESGTIVWIVRAAKAEPESPEAPAEPTIPETPTEPAEPTEPAVPGEPTVPSEPTTPTVPGGTGGTGAATSPSLPGGSSGMTGSFPQTGGSYSGSTGGTVTVEPEFELYAVDTVTIASVTAQEEMTISITVDELDITKISVGQSAGVTMDALPGEHFAATVTEISGTGENSGGSSKFAVELTLEKSGDMLPGMTASVVMTLGTAENVLTVPVAALVEDGAQTVLYTGTDPETGEPTAPVTVTVGVSDGENAEILDGPAEGTTVYYPYYDTLVISDAPVTGSRFPFGR